MKNTHNWDIEIMEKDLYEDEAFELEKEYIRIFKECGRLTNQTDGGDGVSGYVMPEHLKENLSKISKSRWQDKDFRENQMWHRQNGVYKSEEFSKKLSEITSGENNGNYENYWTDEQKKSLSEKRKRNGKSKGKNNSRATRIRCIETGEEFDYIKSACEKYNIKNQSSITIALNNPDRTAYGFHWEKI